MKPIWTDTLPIATRTPPASNGNARASERRRVALPARLMWKDQRGTTRFASAVTRDVSEFDVYVETQSVLSIPPSFRSSNRATPWTRPGSRHMSRAPAGCLSRRHPLATEVASFALRLMVDPKRYTMPSRTAPAQTPLFLQ